jgi:hypothetical protein
MIKASPCRKNHGGKGNAGAAPSRRTLVIADNVYYVKLCVRIAVAAVAQPVHLIHHHGWTSPRLGIRFAVRPETLEIFDPAGRPFASPVELARQAEQERLRAEQERLRAEQEWLRAEQERVRAEQERLRAEQEQLRAEQADERADRERLRAEQADERADRERLRAAQADERADRARLGAEQEHQRAEQLAQRLRALGIDPDAPDGLG